jgi:hypothetical protein
VIAAVDALKLPSAQLSDDERLAADKLEVAIEAHVLNNMRVNGVDFKTEELRPVVIAEVNQRLKRAGWQTQWQPLLEQHALNKAAVKHTGFGLNLAPSDAAFTEAFRSTLA